MLVFRSNLEVNQKLLNELRTHILSFFVESLLIIVRKQPGCLVLVIERSLRFLVLSVWPGFSIGPKKVNTFSNDRDTQKIIE